MSHIAQYDVTGIAHVRVSIYMWRKVDSRVLSYPPRQCPRFLIVACFFNFLKWVCEKQIQESICISVGRW